MKKCPYCAEEIQDKAKVCRYCGRSLVPSQKHYWVWALVLLMFGLVAIGSFQTFGYQIPDAIVVRLKNTTVPHTDAQVPKPTLTSGWVVTYVYSTTPVTIPTFTPVYGLPITWMQLVSLIEVDRTNWNAYVPHHYTCLDLAVDLVANASSKNIKAWVVGVDFLNGEAGHVFSAFETTDIGIVFIEPQRDIQYIKLAVGQPLCDGWTGTNCMGTISKVNYVQCNHSQYCTQYYL